MSLQPKGTGPMRRAWLALATASIVGVAAAAPGGPPGSRAAPAATVGCASARDTPSTGQPRVRATLALRINIPAFRLDVVDSGRTVASYPVAVGAKKWRTPVRRFVVSAVVWNPWWIPPPSDWAREDTVTPPGPGNPMGKVKIELGGAYFVHGSPDSASVGRARSHGCIRMRQGDAVALAGAVLAAANSPLDSATTAAMLATTRTLRL